MAPQAPKRSVNGLIHIKSWSDVVALSTLFGLFLGVVAWGLKLEFRNDQLAARVELLERQVGNGVLPRAEERINNLQRRVDRLEDEG